MNADLEVSSCGYFKVFDSSKSSMIESNKVMEVKMMKPLERGLGGEHKEVIIVSLQILGWFLSQSERTVLIY
jgi:hypothetical protein